MSEQSTRSEWTRPEVTVHGSVEDLTQLKFVGGFDGVEIQMADGSVITGS